MMRALFTSSTGLQAQEIMVDVIANNLANVNTAGFKRSRADFEDLLYESIRPAGASAATGQEIPTGIQVGHGVRPVATAKIFTQGDFAQTENSLDMAIEGKGFFRITMPSGETAYTRSGAFKQDSTGNIVTSDGYLLADSITIPQDTLELSIGSDGTVSVIQAGSGTSTEIGNITLANFPNPAGLSSIGRNLYLPTTASGSETTGTPGTDSYGTIIQGFLELSNVSIVEEMVKMIIAQRAYETNSKVIQTTSDMLRQSSNI